MTDRLDTCAYCRFFSPYSESEGACRRRSPSIIPTTEFDEQGRAVTVGQSVFPMCGSDDWCGEFEVRRGALS